MCWFVVTIQVPDCSPHVTCWINPQSPAARFVTAQDSSPPSVVRKRFFAAGLAACGCQARSKKTRAAVECRFIEHVRRGIRHLRSYLVSSLALPTAKTTLPLQGQFSFSLSIIHCS